MQKLITIFDSDPRRTSEKPLLHDYPELDKMIEEGYVIKQIFPQVLSPQYSRLSLTILLELEEKTDSDSTSPNGFF